VWNDVEGSTFWYIESNNRPFNREVSRQQFKENNRTQFIPSQPNEREACNIHLLCGGLLATHLVCLVQEILRKGSLMPVPQPPKIGDVVENQQAGKKLPQASGELHANSF
jgi:hypothetical protein